MTDTVAAAVGGGGGGRSSRKVLELFHICSGDPRMLVSSKKSRL
ncbi:hypothetical protein LINPERPRIM_LOCUS16368 [Linum perenne]